MENTLGNWIHQQVTYSLPAKVGNVLFIESSCPFL